MRTVAVGVDFGAANGAGARLRAGQVERREGRGRGREECGRDHVAPLVASLLRDEKKRAAQRASLRSRTVLSVRWAVVARGLYSKGSGEGERTEGGMRRVF